MKKNNGFTLIEMMIVVAIIGILAAIAVPSYNQYVQESAIADARASLLGLANAMERHRAQTGSYLGAAADSNSDGNLDNTGVPAIFATQSPESGNAHFNLQINAANATTYTIWAVSTGTVNITLNDRITLQSNGVRNGTGTLANAWN
ncbi:type IV pilin protein [Endozoicomonas numazuensis]|uniref:General secretion pathway protein GspH n=1 Tax=Endozoicomonas numazuensis TaxID=1137799 RepID=A0A081N986_9GAMM|nr:type IV pilin protein [Endozoicomonas numazuensis]KEQ15009.1 hypothetical protein GZ78_24300 [Endozoicomonas numazuensis]